jgi:ADP-heptose:LPS heptosyltransferase
MARSGWKRLALSRLFEASLRPLLNIVGRQADAAGEEPRSILVAEYWHLGDLVMLTPFLKNLRRHYPRTRITLLANAKVMPLIEAQNLVDEVITVRVPWAQHDSRRRKYISRHWIEFFRCLARLRRRSFDWGFSARADVRDNFILWAGGVKRRIGYGFGYGASLLTDVVTPEISRPHFSDRWLHLLEYLDKPTLDRQPELNLTAEERRAARQYVSDLGIRDTEIAIGVHAGSRNPIRQWGEENFFEVAEKLASRFPVKVLWFREPGAREIGSGTEPWLVPVTLPLREFLAVLAQCRLLLCNDTGPMHLATAVGVPVVAVFGATMPAWWGPRRDGSQVVMHEGVWCRPCGDRCHFDEPYCLRAVSIERVVSVAETALAKMVLHGFQEVETHEPANQQIQGNQLCPKEL